MINQIIDDIQLLVTHCCRARWFYWDGTSIGWGWRAVDVGAGLVTFDANGDREAAYELLNFQGDPAWPAARQG